MSFLYCVYIVTYAITSPLLGKYIDSVSNANGQHIHEAMVNVGGIQFTIIFILVMTATFIPKGAFAFNPKMLNDEDLESDIYECAMSQNLEFERSVKDLGAPPVRMTLTDARAR
jgi:hypothetical protein